MIGGAVAVAGTSPVAPRSARPARRRSCSSSLLLALGVAMVVTAVWLVRSTRTDVPALAPLEVMGDRGFAGGRRRPHRDARPRCAPGRARRRRRWSPTTNPGGRRARCRSRRDEKDEPSKRRRPRGGGSLAERRVAVLSPAMASLDVDQMLARFRDRAAAVKRRPLPPVAGEERQQFIAQAQLDFQDFAIIGDAEATIEDGVLVLRVDLRPHELTWRRPRSTSSASTRSPARPASPRDLIAEVGDGERLGLGWCFISERFNIKEAATLSRRGRRRVASACRSPPRRRTTTPATRIVTASYATTMHSLTGGRFTLGLGRGIDPLMRAFGLAPITTAQLEDFAGLLRRLWRGETVIGHDGPAGQLSVPAPRPRRSTRTSRWPSPRSGRDRSPSAGGPSTSSCCTRSSPTRRSSAACAR